MAQCELNYARLQRLLPGSCAGARRSAVSREAREVRVGEGLWFSIVTVDAGPYTTTVRIDQRRAEGAPALLSAPHLTVRIYHDARLAEVVGFCERRRVWPRYDYPNADMLQPDEKAQWNRFLGEWLSLCLHHGWVGEERLPVT